VSNSINETFVRHTPWPAANINGGVTVDLSGLNQVTVSPDQKIVAVGAGNRWGDVYSKLEPLNLGVLGGRWGNVGVGGLLTGGQWH
jgi:FAD/FMN-containing dehydrogenase